MSARALGEGSLGLLIVPYGIETFTYSMRCEPDLLLIVPYGIETRLHPSSPYQQPTFNRTLWN